MNAFELTAYRPERPAAPWEIQAPLSETAGGRNLAHAMGQNSKRRRRPTWRLPRSVIDNWTSSLLIAGLMVGLWALYTWG